MTNSVKAKYLHNLCAGHQYNTSLKGCLQMMLIIRHIKNENEYTKTG